jgi:hypothetical protein
MIKIIFGNSYLPETLEGESLSRVINGRYFRKKFLSVWQEAYSALQIMAGTCIAIKTNMTDVYIALRC